MGLLYPFTGGLIVIGILIMCNENKNGQSEKTVRFYLYNRD